MFFFSFPESFLCCSILLFSFFNCLRSHVPLFLSVGYLQGATLRVEIKAVNAV
uniref:Uncharacterized protein n=1 Tax=Phakopsora pachyrhizi TaxID=170000 RepID=A0A0S1MJT0_PHAPC